MPIRWKLVLGIGVPTLVLSLINIAVSYHDLRQDAIAQTSRYAEERAAHFASVFDAQFSAMAQVARANAAALATAPELTPEQIAATLRRALEDHPTLQGAAIALEPDTPFNQGRPLAAYLTRTEDGGLKIRDLAVEGADYRRRVWYRAAREAQQGLWTEPRVDREATDVIVATYSVPIFAEGRVAGVATVDFPVALLQNVRLDAGAAQMGFVVVSAEGRFVSHPQTGWVMQRTIYDMADALDNDKIRQIGARMLARQTGAERVQDLVAEGYQWIFYQPIPSTGWSLATSVTEDAIMRPVFARLQANVLQALLTLVVIVAVVLAMSFWLTRPIDRMALAYDQLGAGQLDVQVEDVKSRDELGQLARGFNEMTGRLRRYVDALTRETAARQAVESEIAVAREIQSSLLPSDSPKLTARGGFELFAVNEPARQVAGDFFDYLFVSDNELLVVMADVSGKGVPAALFMAVARTVLRQLALDGLEPGAMLNSANRTLLQDNERAMFVTLFCARYNVRTGRLAYANAGHMPPVLIGEDGAVTRLGDSTGTVLGALADQRWEQREATLEIGQNLVLYTDGVSEARSPDGEMFGEDEFERMLAGLSDQSLPDQCQAVLDRLESFQDHARSDDVTLLMLRRTG